MSHTFTKYLYIGLALIALSFTACQGGKTKSLSESFAVDTLVLQDSFLLAPKYSDSLTMQLRFKYLYPRDNDSLRLLIDSILFNRSDAKLSPQELISQQLRSLKETYLQDFEGVASDSLDGDLPFVASEWYDYNEMEELFLVGESILSVSQRISTYQGGAHGSSGLGLVSINLKTKKKMKLDDLFVDDSHEALSQAVQQKLMQMYKVHTLEALADEGFFSPKEIEATDNFMLTSTGIRFCYNEYEIAPYSSGTIVVDLIWDEISSLIRPSSPIEAYI